MIKPELFKFIKTKDFSVFNGGMDVVKNIITGCYQGKVPLDKIIVLTPYNRNISVIHNLVRSIYFPEKKGTWIVGDRVMMTENNPDISVFNGESGVIGAVTPKGVQVQFGENSHLFTYVSKEPKDKSKGFFNLYGDHECTVSKLTTANVLTIDKSQGSEYDIVILYIDSICAGNHINKNRIYTAITRCRRKCFVVTPDVAKLEQACNTPAIKRVETLAQRLQK